MDATEQKIVAEIEQLQRAAGEKWTRSCAAEKAFEDIAVATQSTPPQSVINAKHAAVFEYNLAVWNVEHAKWRRYRWLVSRGRANGAYVAHPGARPYLTAAR